MAPDFGPLLPSDFTRLGEVDRSEHIDGRYVWKDQQLSVEPCEVDVLGWFPGEAESLIARLHAVAAADGMVVGGTSATTLVGVGSLDIQLVRAYPTAMKLDTLYVSRPWRTRGVGRRLTRMVAEHALGLGADSLYISATPTRNTIDAYLRMGARPLLSPDPHLHSMEPDDIHLLLPLATLLAK